MVLIRYTWCCSASQSTNFCHHVRCTTALNQLRQVVLFFVVEQHVPIWYNSCILWVDGHFGPPGDGLMSIRYGLICLGRYNVHIRAPVTDMANTGYSFALLMLPRWVQGGKFWVHPIPHLGSNSWAAAEIGAVRPQIPHLPASRLPLLLLP